MAVKVLVIIMVMGMMVLHRDADGDVGDGICDASADEDEVHSCGLLARC